MLPFLNSPTNLLEFRGLFKFFLDLLVHLFGLSFNVDSNIFYGEINLIPFIFQHFKLVFSLL
jgi:hypothetical protein